MLQIAGRKRWFIDEPPLWLPHSTQPFKAAGFVPGRRLMELELAAGDAMYLPRGYVHSTTTSQSHSAHVTLGINVLTWADMARGFLPACVDDEAFRQALPAGFASRAELRPVLKQRLTQLLPRSPVDYDVLIDQAIAMVQAARRHVPARFRADVSVITIASLLRAPARQRYDVAEAKDRLVMKFRRQALRVFGCNDRPSSSHVRQSDVPRGRSCRGLSCGGTDLRGAHCRASASSRSSVASGGPNCRIPPSLAPRR